MLLVSEMCSQEIRLHFLLFCQMIYLASFLPFLDTAVILLSCSNLVGTFPTPNRFFIGYIQEIKMLTESERSTKVSVVQKANDLDQ